MTPHYTPQVVCEVGKAVGAEGLVAGQIVDIKSEGMAEQVWVSLALHIDEHICLGKHPAACITPLLHVASNASGGPSSRTQPCTVYIPFACRSL